MNTQTLEKKWYNILLREKKKFKKRHSTKTISDCMFIHRNIDRFYRKIDQADKNYIKFVQINDGGFRQLSNAGQTLLNKYSKG